MVAGSIVGDLLNFDAMREALKGVNRVYFVYRIRPGSGSGDRAVRAGSYRGARREQPHSRGRAGLLGRLSRERLLNGPLDPMRASANTVIPPVSSPLRTQDPMTARTRRQFSHDEGRAKRMDRFARYRAFRISTSSLRLLNRTQLGCKRRAPSRPSVCPHRLPARRHLSGGSIRQHRPRCLDSARRKFGGQSRAYCCGSNKWCLCLPLRGCWRNRSASGSFQAPHRKSN